MCVTKYFVMIDVMKVAIYRICYVCIYLDRPLVEITTVTGGCRHVNISWTATNNTDNCSVLYYDVTLSYVNVTVDDHVTVSMITTMNSTNFTGLPFNTQVNVTVGAIGKESVVLSIDSTTESTIAFESMYCMCIFTDELIDYHMYEIQQRCTLTKYIYLHTYIICDWI